MPKKVLIVQGIRGVPASHGGFETFAEFLCQYLVENGWKVIVYCQEDVAGPVSTSKWKGVQRVHIPTKSSGPLGTIVFDFKSIFHSLRYTGVFLTLGYNTAVFNTLYRLFGKPNVINMDGIEWKRQKWGVIARVWFWINERVGCWVGNHLVADHPEIENHLATRVSRNKITMIPYGGKEIIDPNEELLANYGLVKHKYAIVIARPEPENSILEIVEAFSQEERDFHLLILGNYDSKKPYHRVIKEAASENVIFPGAIYESEVVEALRFYSLVYIHGHQVGGTNPSLVEAIGAGNAIVAHDNKFNRWVAKDGALYFRSIQDLSECFDEINKNSPLVNRLKANSRENYRKNFVWNSILSKYEDLLNTSMSRN